jgi:transcription elongation GreA/GreB family factor
MCYLKSQKGGIDKSLAHSTWKKMSRAFVKEQDGDPADEPLPPESPHPLYVTPDGRAQLQARAARLAASLARRTLPSEPAAAEAYRREKRDWRILDRKLGRAILVDPTKAAGDVVAFGHWVRAEDDEGTELLYRIVGEDQADPARGWISWLSPLGQALTGAAVEDRVVWRRPIGDLALTVTAIAASPPLAER